MHLERNPSSAPVAFDIAYQLERTDGGTGTPATVEVRLPAYVPGELRNDLMATVSASASTITDGSGTSLTSVAVGTAFTVTQTERAAVVLTATPPGHSAVNGMQLVAAPELALIGANTAATGTPTISGVVQVGGDLEAETADISDDDGRPADGVIVFTYQWHRGTTSDFTPVPGTAIAGEESDTYRLVDDDRGRYIRFVVSFADSLGFVETLTSNAQVLGDADVCSRADGVRDALVSATKDTPCNEILSLQLATITTLDLSDSSIASLQASDFAGLTSLTELNLSGNRLTSVPAGVLPSSLTSLNLSGNNLSNFPSVAIAQLTNLGEGLLDLSDNPSGAAIAFSVAYEIEVISTDTSGGNATVTLQLHLPAYMPMSLRDQRATLSLADPASGTVPDPATVALDTDFTVTQAGTAVCDSDGGSTF